MSPCPPTSLSTPPGHPPSSVRSHACALRTVTTVIVSPPQCHHVYCITMPPSPCHPVPNVSLLSPPLIPSSAQSCGCTLRTVTVSPTPRHHHCVTPSPTSLSSPQCKKDHHRVTTTVSLSPHHHHHITLRASPCPQCPLCPLPGHPCSACGAVAVR